MQDHDGRAKKKAAQGSILDKLGRITPDEVHQLYEFLQANFRPFLALAAPRNDADALLNWACREILKSQHTYRPQPDRTPNVWVYAILHNGIKRAWKPYYKPQRRDALNAITISTADLTFDAAAANPAENLPLSSDLGRAFATLEPAEVRRVAHLKWIVGHTRQEMAVLLGVPDSTVQSLEMRARAQLRQKLGAWRPESGKRTAVRASLKATGDAGAPPRRRPFA